MASAMGCDVFARLWGDFFNRPRDAWTAIAHRVSRDDLKNRPTLTEEPPRLVVEGCCHGRTVF
jgi:hypothetical protein